MRRYGGTAEIETAKNPDAPRTVDEWGRKVSVTPARRTNDSCKDSGPVQEHGEGPFCFFFTGQVGRIDRELAVGVYGVEV